LIVVDGPRIGVFKVSENSSLTGFLDSDGGGGFETVFYPEFDIAVESL
jgi:hypothetical protein